MEYQKITNLLGNILYEVPKSITKKWIEFHDQLRESYSTSKKMRFKTPMLRSDLCDYSDAYIVVKGNIAVTDPNVFKNNAPLISCISKINDTLIDIA